MYAFIHHGSGFTGALNYILDTDGHNNKTVRMLASEGVDVPLDKDGDPVFDAGSIAQSFRLQAALRPGISNPVRHLILSCPPEDREKLTPHLWLALTRDYMNRMHITNTQFVITTHEEKDNPHAHIVYNRIDNDGQPLDERFFFRRSNKACRDITREHGLTWGKNKAESLAQDIHRPEDKVLYQTARIVTEELYRATDIGDLRLSLMARGIVMREIRHGERTGVVFMVKGRNGKQYSFSGRRLGPYLTYPNIKKVFQQKNQENRHFTPLRPVSMPVMVHHLIDMLKPIEKTPSQSAVSGKRHRKTPEELQEEFDAGRAGSMQADLTDRRFESRLH